MPGPKRKLPLREVEKEFPRRNTVGDLLLKQEQRKATQLNARKMKTQRLKLLGDVNIEVAKNQGNFKPGDTFKFRGHTFEIYRGARGHLAARFPK